MAKNEFLPFGIAEGANVLSNQEYERLAARFNGFTSGVAKSKELNTVWRQSSVMSSALAQFIVDSDNKDLLDNGDIADIKNRLVAAIKQTISGVGYVTTAAMNLELNKKFDKASISGVLGNDNDKVPSLNLFTIEIGKLAALGYSYSKIESDGKYQPKGEYATSQALSDGLSKKFDKIGGDITGQVNVSSAVIASQIAAKTINNSTLQLNPIDSSPRIEHRKNGGTWYTHTLPDATGTLMQVGDYGLGATTISGVPKDMDLSINKNRPFGFFCTEPSSVGQPSNVSGYGGGINFGRDPDASAKMLYSPDWSTKLYIRTPTGKDSMSPWHEFYSTANTVIDRNGNLKLINSNELSDCPVGAPIPWTQSTAPAGYLVCNGQSFNKATYPLLAKAYPTAVLPDLRGEFLRGLDAGRNVDSGRAVLSSQLDENKEHNHNIILKNASGDGGSDQHALRTLAVNVNNATYTTEKSGGKESRPRNIAFLYIVRAA